MPQPRQPWDQVLEMLVQPRVDTEIVVPRVGKIKTHRELVDARIAQRQVLLLGHQRPVGYQDGVGRARAALDGADDLHHVAAHERLAARDLHHARAQYLHVTHVVGGFEVARFVARTAVVAVLAVARARVGDFEGYDDGALGEPVQRPPPDDPEGLRQRNLSQMAMVSCGAVFSKRASTVCAPGRVAAGGRFTARPVRRPHRRHRPARRLSGGGGRPQSRRQARPHRPGQRHARSRLVREPRMGASRACFRPLPHDQLRGGRNGRPDRDRRGQRIR